jgi:hypothetical protein
MSSDNDVTLGEVYRAVLSLRDELVETRKEWHDVHHVLRKDVSQHSLSIRACEVKLDVLNPVPERLSTMAGRVTALETETKHADPAARIGALVGTALATLFAWLLSRGG